jgi:CRP-like cAMP-binding protein
MKLSSGDFFGEIALLSGKPRQATVRAVGEVTVLVIGRDTFVRLCGNLFEILRRNMSTYSSMELPDEESKNESKGTELCLIPSKSILVQNMPCCPEKLQ